MPTYDYMCLVCHHRFEAFQSMSEKPLDKCPVCGEAVKRLISPGAGLIFKGSGFYITDYKNKERKKTRPDADSTPKSKPSQEKKKDKTKDKESGSGAASKSNNK